MPDSPSVRSLVEMVAQFKSDVQTMQLVVDTLASIGDSCEAPVAIQAREALVRIGNFVPTVLDAIAEPSEANEDWYPDDHEIKYLAELAAAKRLPKYVILKQALRMYYTEHKCKALGDRFYVSDASGNPIIEMTD